MSHNTKIILGLVIMGLIGAFSAFHGQPGLGWSDTVVAVLMMLEHFVNGNTSA